MPEGHTIHRIATDHHHRDLCLRCGTPIRTIELGGRPCDYCPSCQPLTSDGLTY